MILPPKIEEKGIALCGEQVKRAIGFDCGIFYSASNVEEVFEAGRLQGLNEALGVKLEEGIEWMQEGYSKERKGYTLGFNTALSTYQNNIKSLIDNSLIKKDI